MTTSTPTHADSTLYLYTSLTAGSSHITTATSRLRTILSARRIPFVALDVATDEKARMLWGRRAGGRKLPGLVRAGLVLADLDTVEEWNEYGELRENLVVGGDDGKGTPSKAGALPKGDTGMGITAKGTTTTPNTGASAEAPATETARTEGSLTTAMRQVGLEAAKKAGDAKSKARTEALDAMRAKSGSVEKVTPTPEAGKGKGNKVSSTTEQMTEGGATASTEEVKKDESIGADQGSEMVEREESEKIPTSQDAEAAANEAIRADKSHIILKGHGRTPEGNTPPGEGVVAGSEEVKGGSDDAGSGTKNAVSASEEGEARAGKKTQAQGAARGECVGQSVGD